MTLELRYIPLSTIHRWNRNYKLHDIGALIQSFKIHGFRDPLGWDKNLNGGEGGIVEGNGRDEALEAMKKDGENPPRGIIEKDGEWLVPVLFGMDAESQEAAEAYGLDHNTLTMLGGNYDLNDLLKMYDSGINDLLLEFKDKNIELASFDENTLDSLKPSKSKRTTKCPQCGYEW
jgi:hypothetical protein